MTYYEYKDIFLDGLTLPFAFVFIIYFAKFLWSSFLHPLSYEISRRFYIWLVSRRMIKSDKESDV